MTDVPPTPISTIQRIREIRREEGLRHIYAGNVPEEATTSCHSRGCLLMRRSGYRIVENHVDPEGRCPECNTPLAGIGMGE